MIGQRFEAHQGMKNSRQMSFNTRKKISTGPTVAERCLRGAIAGTLATVPMTAIMMALYRSLPAPGRAPLPPVQITAEVARRTGMRDELQGRRLVGGALAAHFGYGAATGAVFPLLFRSRRHSLALGAAYGVGIWALSYLGWIPAARILEPATRHPPQRNFLMVAAHVVWGAALAGAWRLLQGNR